MDLNNKILSFKKNFALKQVRKCEALIVLYNDYIDFIEEDTKNRIDQKYNLKKEKVYRTFQEKYFNLATEQEIFDVVYAKKYDEKKVQLRFKFRAYREKTRREVAKLNKVNAKLQASIDTLKEQNDEGSAGKIEEFSSLINVNNETIKSKLDSIPAFERTTEDELFVYSESLKEEFKVYCETKLKQTKAEFNFSQDATKEEVENAVSALKTSIEGQLSTFKDACSEKYNAIKDKKQQKCRHKIEKYKAKLEVKKQKFEALSAEYTQDSTQLSQNQAIARKEKLEAEIKKYSKLVETESNPEKVEKINKILNTLQAEYESINVEKASITSLIKDDEVLSINDLCMYFGGIKAVNHLSFSVKEKEIFGLIGPNGAGKTTVFNCITQFYKATSGEIVFRNKANEIVDLKKEAVHNVILQGIVRTFQNLEVIKDITVLDNLLIAAHRNYTSGLFRHMIHSPILKVEESVIKARAVKVLKFMGLLKYKDMYAWGLPYGILKKIEIARTLMCNPQLIILDEPAAGLNDSETIELAALIRKIRDEYNSTILLVEHDMGLVMDVCDRICAISFGNLLGLGTPEEIQQNKAVQEAYLGVSEE